MYSTCAYKSIMAIEAAGEGKISKAIRKASSCYFQIHGNPSEPGKSSSVFMGGSNDGLRVCFAHAICLKTIITHIMVGFEY